LQSIAVRLSRKPSWRKVLRNLCALTQSIKFLLFRIGVKRNRQHKAAAFAYAKLYPGKQYHFENSLEVRLEGPGLLL